MTARQLQALPDDSPDTYAGGMQLDAGDCIAVKSRRGVITLGPNIDLQRERGFIHLLLDLTPQESAELRGALERAEAAAKNYERNR